MNGWSVPVIHQLKLVTSMVCIEDCRVDHARAEDMIMVIKVRERDSDAEVLSPFNRTGSDICQRPSRQHQLDTLG